METISVHPQARPILLTVVCILTFIWYSCFDMDITNSTKQTLSKKIYECFGYMTISVCVVLFFSKSSEKVVPTLKKK